MSGTWPVGGVVMNRLRIEAPGLDPLSARLRAGMMLAGSDLHPASLAPSAILCIRRLIGPAPNPLPLGGDRVLPPAEWARQVAQTLERLILRAVRPARGPVSNDAEAVLFADRSEWLACLALDWLDGRLAHRWWWRDLARSMDLTRSVASAWLDAPTAVPASLALLANARRAGAFASSLPDSVCRQLTTRMVDQFGLVHITKALAVDSLNTAASPALPSDDPPRRINPSWSLWLSSEQPARLSIEAHTLLAIGLTIRHRPTTARAPSFAAEFSHWRQEQFPTPPRPHHPAAALRSHARPDPSPTRPPSPQPPPPSATSSVNFGHSEHGPDSISSSPISLPSDSPASASIPVGAPSPPTPLFNPPFLENSPPPTPSPSPVSPLSPPPLAPSITLPPPPESTPILPSLPHLDLHLIPPSHPRFSDHNPIAEPAIDGVETNHGGIFYLINLALHLDLYGDFTNPTRPGLDLPIADFLALVSESLIGPALQQDPIWPLLANLAHRTTSIEPGSHFHPPESWRLPPFWLRSFPEPGDWPWSILGGRLRLWHHAGFPVLDIPLDNSTHQLATEIRPYQTLTPIRLKLPPEPRVFPSESPQKTWLGWLVPYLRFRLLRGLGLNESDDLTSILFQHHATIHLSSDRLDVVLRLEDLPISVRLSGLDRDPGFVPSAGRTIAFHFR